MMAGWGFGRPGQVEQARRDFTDRLRRASLGATSKAARNARDTLAGQLPGKLGGALGWGSDQRKGRQGKDTPFGGFRVSGWIYVRGKPGENDRAAGALISATQGAEISPILRSWLWIATDEIPRLAGKRRMTPKLYIEGGYEKSIGPLVFVPGRHAGEALLIVRSVQVDRFGRPGKARAFKGKLRASSERRDMIVAFVGLKRTSRAPVANVQDVVDGERRNLPTYRDEALK